MLTHYSNCNKRIYIHPVSNNLETDILDGNSRAQIAQIQRCASRLCTRFLLSVFFVFSVIAHRECQYTLIIRPNKNLPGFRAIGY